MNSLPVLTLLLVAVAAGPSVRSPYAGQQTRHVKSLDAATISALRKGEGHAMALPAELNHYPGPRHVLAMAEHLALTPAQRTQTNAIYDGMHKSAVRLGLSIIDKESALDHAFERGTITEASLRALTAQIAELNGRLRNVHLSAHLAMKRILTPGQVQTYDSMRGYMSDMPGMQP